VIGLGAAKWIAISIAVITVVGGATAAVHHYNTLVEERQALEDRAALAETELQTQRESAQRYRESTEEQLTQLQGNLEELGKSFAQERKRSEELGKLFAKHDLTKLATKKPGLLDKRINDGTSRMWLDLEQATRSDAGRAPPSN
jgi:TolA-binding protein